MNLENISEGKEFAITINANDSVQYFGKEGRMVSAYGSYMRIFNKMRHWCDFDLVPEYSFNQYSDKMWQGPRLHFHGHVRITDVDRFIEIGYTQLKDKCIFKIDTLSDDTKWANYISKSEELLKKMCKTRKLPYRVRSCDMEKAHNKDKNKKEPLEWFKQQ